MVQAELTVKGVFMKALSVLALMFLVSVVSHAQAPRYNNPLQRVCRVNNGLFWAVSVSEPKLDQLPFCQFGEAYMGSLDLMNLLWENTSSQAVENYLANVSGEACDMDPISAQKILGHIDQQEFAFCLFSDNSIIGYDTFKRGPKASENQALNAVLRSR